MTALLFVAVPTLLCAWINLEIGMDPGGDQPWLIARAVRAVYRALRG